ncbi:MAG: protein kinase [Sandaracinaceae bacterium]|nr:protein kinase [Sandaracinaceae bacterium]
MSRVARRRSLASFGPGTVIADRYRVEDKLGEGGMAEVYRAFDIASGQRVAVKILHPDVATNPEAVERTKREGQLLSGLDNPAIVQVQTWGQLDDGTVFLVMELLEGETLGARMRRGTLDPQELAPIVAGCCAGLFAAHAKGIVHRDLKPDNIYLCPTDKGLQVKLLDFGISKIHGSKRLTQTGEVLGTPRYMSPEQLGAEHDVDPRVDIYALGVILYEALAGQPPFLASTPTDLIIAILNGKVAPLHTARPDVPPNVEGVVMRAMSKVRAARFDSAMDLAEAYIDAVGGVAAVRQMQRRGMPTRAFGGKVELPSVPETNPPPAPSGGGKLKLGTFSGLPEVDAARVAEAAVAEAPPKRRVVPETRTREMGASPGAPSPDPVAEPVKLEPQEEPLAQADPAAVAARRPMPHTRETPLGMIPDTPVPDVRPPRVVPATEMMDSTGLGLEPPARPVALPPRKKSSAVGRALLVVGALLAGAASAGVVILVLSWKDTPEDTPIETPEAVSPEPLPEPVAAVDAGAPAAELLPEAPDPPTEVAAADPTPDPAPRRRRSERRRSESDTDSSNGSNGPFLPGFQEEPDPNSPRELLRSARQALDEGDPARCVSILDRAIQSGAPAIALRRRGECYDRMGRRDAAIQDYQRFCRIAGDHPAIADVRPLLESWGQRCE